MEEEYGITKYIKKVWANTKARLVSWRCLLKGHNWTECQEHRLQWVSHLEICSNVRCSWCLAPKLLQVYNEAHVVLKYASESIIAIKDL